MIKLINISFGTLLGHYQEQWTQKNPFQLGLLIIIQIQRLPNYQSILQRQSHTVN